MTIPLNNLSGTPTPTPMTPHDVRLRLLEMGYSKLCVVEGKRPRGDEWQAHVTTPDRLELLERLFHGAHSTGLVCDDVIGIDVDILHKAAADAVDQAIRDWFPGKRLLVRYGQAPKRLFLFRTAQPIDGYKTKFYAPESADLVIRDGRRKRGPGIEILGRGNQFVAFGIHEDTKQPYLWPDGSPLDVRRNELPEIGEADLLSLTRYLAELLREQFGYTVAAGKVDDDQMDFSQAAPQDGRGDDAPLSGLSQEERLQQAEVGGTVGLNDAILQLAMKRHDEGVPCEAVIKELMDISQSAFDRLADDDEKKIKWNWHAQRVQIEKSVYGDINKRGREHARLIASLSEDFRQQWEEIEKRGGIPELYQKRGMGRGAWAVKHKGAAKEIPTIEQSEIPTMEAPDQPKQDLKPPFILRPRGLIDVASIPRRKWLGGGEFYQRRTVSVTFAPGDFGKTTLGMTEAVSMNTMRDLIGDQPDEKLRVWIHNGEDTNEEIDRRLAAICLQYGIPLEEIADIFITTGADIPLRVASGYGELEINKPLIKCIHEQIGDNKIDIAQFDPLVTMHGTQEGDNSKMDRVIRIFTGIADARNCAIGVHHHMRKGPAGEDIEYTVDDGRGASSVKDAARAARVLNRMKEKQADELGIPQHERASYIRIDRAKGNNSATRPPRWVTFTSVSLSQGDDVGVLVPWSPPKEGTPEAAAARQTAETVFLAILFRFNTAGRRASDRKGANFAPKLFAKEREAKNARVGVLALETAMRRLIDEGRVEIVDGYVGSAMVHELRIRE
jgi:hypothetical protein